MLEKIFSIILCILSIIVYYSANTFDMSFIGNSGLGPDFFPKFISIILCILSGINLYFEFKKNKKLKEDTIKNNNLKETLIIIIIFASYILLIDKLGYLTSTILFSFIVISILKKKSFILKILYSLIFPITLYLLFTLVFKVSLPIGILI